MNDEKKKKSETSIFWLIIGCIFFWPMILTWIFARLMMHLIIRFLPVIMLGIIAVDALCIIGAGAELEEFFRLKKSVTELDPAWLMGCGYGLFFCTLLPFVHYGLWNMVRMGMRKEEIKRQLYSERYLDAGMAERELRELEKQKIKDAELYAKKLVLTMIPVGCLGAIWMKSILSLVLTIGVFGACALIIFCLTRSSKKHYGNFFLEQRTIVETKLDDENGSLDFLVFSDGSEWKMTDGVLVGFDETDWASFHEEIREMPVYVSFSKYGERGRECIHHIFYGDRYEMI